MPREDDMRASALLFTIEMSQSARGFSHSNCKKKTIYSWIVIVTNKYWRFNEVLKLEYEVIN